MTAPPASLDNEHPVKTDEAVLLRARDLHKTYGAQRVLDGVSCDIRRGQVVLLRGPNGSGKTTLLNILTGYLEPDAGTLIYSTGQRTDRIDFPRPWWKAADLFDHFTPERVARSGIGRTWQEVRLFRSQSVSDNVAVATPGQRGENPFWAAFRPGMIRSQEARNSSQSKEILEALGLHEKLDVTAGAISLGQSKRVAIARAVRGGARVLFLDEPLAGLDAKGVAEAIDLLNKLVCDSGLTLVIVEHVLNIPLILPAATAVWTLSGGRLTLDDPNVLRASRSPQVGGVSFKELLEASGSPLQPTTEQRLSGGAVLSTFSIPEAVATTDKVRLEVVDLQVRRGRRLVVGEDGPGGANHGLSFSLRHGELAVLQAPNGWGKTTLLETIAGLLAPERGEIRLNGRNITHLQTWRRARLGVSLLRSGSGLFASLTIRQILHLVRVDPAPSQIVPFLDRRMSTLSGGEAKKVALACAGYAGTLRIGLFDEPMTALDNDAVHALIRTLPDLLISGTLLVAVPSAALH